MVKITQGTIEMERVIIIRIQRLRFILVKPLKNYKKKTDLKKI